MEFNRMNTENALVIHYKIEDLLLSGFRSLPLE